MNQPPETRPGAAARAKAWGIFALKALVTVSLLGWLSQSGVLQLSSLRLLVGSWPILAATLGTWFVVSVALSSSRWRILLRIVDVELGAPRAAALQLMALFFNGVVPGNVGGDLMKNLYVAGKSPRATRKTLLALVLVERLVGLSGLMAMASVIVLCNLPSLLAESSLRAPLIALACMAVALVAGPLALLAGLHLDSVRRALDRAALWHPLVAKICAALALMRTHRTRILQSLGLSMLIHGACMGYFTLLSGIYGDPGLSLPRVGVLFPLGILSVVLPVSLAGLGVGHLAFEQLFRMVGAANGANVFNLYVIGQLAPSMIGAIPWLLESRSGSAERSEQSVDAIEGNE